LSGEISQVSVNISQYLGNGARQVQGCHGTLIHKVIDTRLIGVSSSGLEWPRKAGREGSSFPQDLHVYDRTFDQDSAW